MKRTGLGVRESLSESQKLPVSSWREDEKAFQTVIKANTKALRQACHSQKDGVRRIAEEHWVRVEGGARPGKTEADHTAPPTLWRSVWVLMHPARFPGWGAKVRRGRSIVKVTEHPSVEAIRYSHFLTVCSVSRLCPSGQCPCHSAEPLDGSWHPSHLFLFPKDLFWYWMSLLIRVYRFQPIV